MPGDGIDNDCDGKIDEETRDGIDNDGDGQIDEDLELVSSFSTYLYEPINLSKWSVFTPVIVYIFSAQVVFHVHELSFQLSFISYRSVIFLVFCYYPYIDTYWEQ